MAKTENNNLEELSHADKILISIYRVSNGTTERVPFENLVLQTWRDFPVDFSLPNYPEFPDSSVISKRLYSNLITKRFVVSLSNRVYRLSDKGLLEAKRILDLAGGKGESEKSNITIHLNREEEQFLDNALRSKTLLLWGKGDKESLIDYDVRVFFQFSTGTPIKSRKRKVETAKDAIQKAIELEMPEANELKKIFDFLVQKFPQLFQEK